LSPADPAHEGFLASSAVSSFLGRSRSHFGREWVVQRVHTVTEEDLDRRLVARELVPELNPIAA
jgi:hypothetical protein